MSGRRFAAVAILAPLVVFGAVAAQVSGDGRGFGIDEPVAGALSAVAPISSDEVHIDPVLSIATLLVAGLTGLVLIGLLARRQLKAALYLTGAIGASVLLSSVAKEIVQRPPIEGPADEYSFPSGSATWCMATCAAAVLLAEARERRPLAIAGALFALAYAAIVVWEEWHYASDVVAGWCLALVSATGLWVGLGRPRSRLLPLRERSRGASLGYPSS